MKKVLAVLLSMALLFASCANNPDDTNSNSPDTNPDNAPSSLSSFSIPFSDNDSFNPYTVKSSLNIAIMPLLYDSLVTVDNSFGFSPLLAESVVRTDPLNISVTLKSGITFSNGTAMTAEDVVYSFYQGKNSSSYFSSKLSNFSKAAVSEGKIIFTLSSPEDSAENNLDFPITSRAAGNINPIGSGRYTLDSASYSLIPNHNYFKQTEFTLEKISCVSIPYDDSLFTAIKSGSIDIVPAELSLGSFVGTYCNTKSVHTSNFVFLGVSGTDALLDTALRKYISASLNRGSAASGIPVSTFTPSSLPIHPMKSNVFELNLNFTEKNPDAKALLPSESYSFSDAGNLFKGENKISLSLLYLNENSEKNMIANAIADILSDAGIEVQLVGKNYNEYLSEVAAGNFDLYLGETKLTNSLNLNPLLTSSAFALSPSEELKNIYSSFNSGEKSLSEFLSAFSEELPLIPLMFKNTALTYSKSVSSDMSVSITDSYLSLQNIR